LGKEKSEVVCHFESQNKSICGRSDYFVCHNNYFVIQNNNKFESDLLDETNHFVKQNIHVKNSCFIFQNSDDFHVILSNKIIVLLFETSVFICFVLLNDDEI
jgi:hypothetical protein